MDYSSKPADYFEQARPEMTLYVPSDAGKILDIGCGNGAFIRTLRDMGRQFESWGIEIEPGAAKSAESILDHVITGDVNQAVNDLPDRYFDCIVANDVFEHLVNPVETLRILAPKLSQNGVVVCSLPNLRYFDNLMHLIFTKDFRYEESGIRDRTHLRFFTKKSIPRLFEEAGYELISIEGINGYLGSWKFSILNALTFGWLSDTRPLQFACVASPKRDEQKRSQ